MEKKRYAVKSPGRGGARTGAGRKKGSTNKISLEDLMTELEGTVGMTYAERLAINYQSAISRSDWGGVRDYDRVFLGKLVADKQEITTVEDEDQVEAKALAFAEALSNLAAIGKKQ